MRSEIASVVTHVSGYGNAIVDERKNNQWLKSIIDHYCQGFSEQRLCYGSGWRSEMTPLVGSTQTVTEVRYSPECGRRVKLGGFWFQVYHLERANPYDMI